MRIMFINPNTTRSMTDKVRAAAQAVAAPQVDIEAMTSPFGPPAIQGPEDGDAAIPGLLAALKSVLDNANTKGGQTETGDVDGFVLACFDDTGLAQCRELTSKPVIGIGEAAFHASMMLGHRFSVVTTLAVSVPVIEQNIEHYGLASWCQRVRASDVPVLSLEEPGSDAESRISEEIARALVEDECGAIVLGCAGMADLAARLAQKHRVPVIDGVAAAVGMCSGLISLQRSM